MLLSCLARAAPKGSLKSFGEWISTNQPADLKGVSSFAATKFRSSPDLGESDPSTPTPTTPKIPVGLELTGARTSPSPKASVNPASQSSPSLGSYIASQCAPPAPAALTIEKSFGSDRTGAQTSPFLAARVHSASSTPSIQVTRPGPSISGSITAMPTPDSKQPQKPSLLGLKLSSDVSMRMEVKRNEFVGGRADYTIGYGKQLGMSFAVVEAKSATESVDRALYQTMVYMGEFSYNA